MERLPADAASRGFVVLPRPVTLPRSRLTADCGPESICAVLNYWGKAGTVQEVSHQVRDPRAEGIFSNSIPPLARRHGLKGSVVEGSVGRIKKAVDRGVPPIIMVSSGGGNFHYFVVTGYNDREQVVVCEDYQDSKRLISYEQIEEIWTQPDHFMVEIELTTAQADFLAASDREAKGRYKEAEELYARAIKADPEHVEARIGRANCLLFQKKHEAALAEYRRAFELSPSDPKVLNNLANAYVEVGRELAEAESLAGRAVDLYTAEIRRRRAELEREPRSFLVPRRRKELSDLEFDLACTLGTLGQARAAHGRHDTAISAWKASYDHLPLTEFDLRARRLCEIGRSYRALSMPAEARAHFERALAEARDPKQRAEIEAALRTP